MGASPAHAQAESGLTASNTSQPRCPRLTSRQHRSADASHSPASRLRSRRPQSVDSETDSGYDSVREQPRGWGAVIAVWVAVAVVGLVALAFWWLTSDSEGGWDEESSGETLRSGVGCSLSGVPPGDKPKLDRWQGEGTPPDRCPTEAERESASQWRVDNYVKCETSRHDMSVAAGAAQAALVEATTPGALVGPADMEHHTGLTVALWDEFLSSIEALRDCEGYDEALTHAWNIRRAVLNMWYLCRHEWGDTIDCGSEPATPSESPRADPPACGGLRVALAASLDELVPILSNYRHGTSTPTRVEQLAPRAMGLWPELAEDIERYEALDCLDLSGDIDLAGAAHMAMNDLWGECRSLYHSSDKVGWDCGPQPRWP